MKPSFSATVMVGYSTVRQRHFWSKVDLDAFLIREIRRPPYRRTLFVVDDNGHELLACELGVPEPDAI
jgi:hypothetical protein